MNDMNNFDSQSYGKLDVDMGHATMRCYLAKVADGWVRAAIHEILTATLIKYISKDGLEYY